MVSVIGCGGKTALIRRLAEDNANKKVLISTTTQIMPVVAENIVLKTNLSDCKNHIPQKGIQCLGLLNAKGKLGSLPNDLLQSLLPNYDLVLLEADGSKGLPYKGWQSHEPILIKNTDQTIGVVTLNGVNRPANNKIVHRLPEFLKLTGLKEDQLITLDAIERMICGKNGMFEKSVGKTTLFVNQVEDEYTKKLAERWLKTIKAGSNVYSLFYGSVKRRIMVEI